MKETFKRIGRACLTGLEIGLGVVVFCGVVRGGDKLFDKLLGPTKTK